MTNEDTEKTIATLCRQSHDRLPFPNAAAVDAALRPPNQPGSPDQLLAEQLRTLLSNEEYTGFDTFDLRCIRDNFILKSAIGQSTDEWDAVIDIILSCLPAGTELPPLDATVWPTAIDIARGLKALNISRHPSQRIIAVANSGKRMKERQYTLTVHSGAYELDKVTLHSVTSEIRNTFARLGSFHVLSILYRILHTNNKTGFDMYLPVRNYDVHRRTPSIPYGYLINLAVSVPVNGTLQDENDKRPENLLRDAIELARDMVSTMNVETYNQYTLLGTKPRRLESALREIALHDHLFCLVQQWPVSLAPTVLSEFFGSTYDKIMHAKYGWTPQDAAKLYLAVKAMTNRDPKVISSSALSRYGISRWRFQYMKDFFCHNTNTVNSQYASPLAAQTSDFMFKPLIELGDDKFLVPALSLAGPAFYEATVAALRNAIDSQEVSTLQGNGTERVVSALLKEAGFSVTVRGASYQLSQNASGECDLVVESDSHILFVECKAKSLTRGAMAGVPGDAFLDFAGGMLAAQAQALRHERVLREYGTIKFAEEVPDVVWHDRSITRMSVTLLEHGALQDRMLLFNLYETLLNTKVVASDEFDKTKQVTKLQNALADMRSESQALEALGVSLNEQSMASSLSVGALSVMLDGALDLAHFIRRVDIPCTYMTYNPIFEYKMNSEEGLLD